MIEEKSVKGIVWRQKQVSESKILELCRSFEISDLLAKIIFSRIQNLEQIAGFLNPKIKRLLPDPFHLLDMQKAVDRTIAAMSAKQKICIFADYDVDGATSGALLKSIFRDLGHICDIYVPDRIEEGYGPTSLAMQRIKDKGTDLLITVDCGCTAHEALGYAKGIGLDVIVIDHHIGTENLPEVVAVINPNRTDEKSEYGYLAAVGVSFLFAVALISKLKKQNYFMHTVFPDVLRYMDLVALGTVCDVVNLTGLNRAFVTTGLQVMKQSRNLGIKALLNIANLNDEAPCCYHLGFVLGPMINAGGRVGKANLGAHLLSTESEIEAHSIAKELEKHNNERKVIEMIMLREALDMVPIDHNESIIFVAKEGWHPGVIGVISGRLKEKFNKPTAVIAINDGVGKASCRSIAGLDFGAKIIDAKNKGLVLSGGGHAMASGFTVEVKKLSLLREFLEDAFRADMDNMSDLYISEYDFTLTTSGINNHLIDELRVLEPFGQGNHDPIFRVDNLLILNSKIVADKHIRCLLAPNRNAYGSSVLHSIAFNAVGTAIQDVLLNPRAQNISVIGTIKVNNWQNNSTIQLHIKDVVLT